MTAISKRVAAFLAGLAVLVSGQASFLSAAAQERPSAEQSGSGETVSFDAQQYPSYTAYRQQHEDVYPDAGICLEIRSNVSSGRMALRCRPRRCSAVPR